MNTLAFTYTKKDGSTSERVLAVNVKPSNFYAGTDISELSQEQQGEYINALAKLHDAYLTAVQSLNDHFDLNHRYRQFDPKLMKVHESESLSYNEYIKGN